MKHPSRGIKRTTTSMTHTHQGYHSQFHGYETDIKNMKPISRGIKHTSSIQVIWNIHPGHYNGTPPTDDDDDDGLW